MPVTNSAPPPAGAPRSSSKAAPKKPLREQRAEALDGLGQLIQVPLLALRQYADAGTLGMHWPNVAREVAALADSQEPVARFVDPLIKVGPYTALVAAVLPFAMQVAVNHGMVPPGAMGTVPANMLSAQVEAGLAAAEMEALQAQLEAEKAAQEIRDRIRQQRKDMADSQASQATVVETANPWGP